MSKTEASPLPESRPLLQLDNVYKAYEDGLTPALNGVSLIIRRGETVAIMGPSGCGKSTLLNLIGRLDLPSSGSVSYLDHDMDLGQSLHQFFRKSIGLVFQFHHLLPILTLQENVELPLLADSSISKHQREEKAARLLDSLGLAHKKDAYANRVSGGERQRAAIARALVNDPPLILADEPTGSVDSITAEIILDKLMSHTKHADTTLLIATHDKMIAEHADTIIHMKDGKIVSITQDAEKKEY